MIARHTAAQLLAIPPQFPERLFTGEASTAELEYRRLAAQWHPDRCGDPQANAVFAHVRALYEEARNRLAGGTWEAHDVRRFTAKNGRRYEFRHVRRHEIDAGEMLIGRTAVGFVLPANNADLMAQAQRVLTRFPYADERMREQVGPALPSLPPTGQFETAAARVMVLSKPADMLLLRDVLAHYGGRLDARHVAWIISGALNLACYLQYAGLVHNAISPDTYFISPRRHVGALLGGWWYACRAGQRLLALPARTVQYAPSDLLVRKVADFRTDLELVRAMGRELLGDVTGLRLTREKAAPEAMIQWLRLPASADAIDEYRVWQRQVLQDSFGARRFVEMAISHSDVYQS
jgi:hypothetical protein